MKKLTVAVLAALGLTPLPSFAQSSYAQSSFAQRWYAGVGIGRGNLNIDSADLGVANAQVGDNATSYTARLGYMFTPYLGLELGYYDLGEYDFSGTVLGVGVAGVAKAKSVGISVVGNLPIGEVFDVYGRVGYANSELKVSATAGNFTASEKDNQGGATYGVGGRWKFGRNWGVFAEWMKNDKIQVDSYLAGVDFRF